MRRSEKAGQRGMTLIEVLVAILILGTAVASLLALVAQHTNNAGRLRENVLARIAAENVMVATMLDEEVNVRDDQGTVELATHSYDWEVVRSASPIEGLEIVTVEIREGERLLASLSTLSPEAQP